MADSFRTFEGVTTAELQALYTAAKNQYLVSLKGPYVVNGRTYTPPSPDSILEQIKMLGNELFRRQNVKPNAPDLGMIQTSFSDAGRSQSTRSFLG